MLEVKQLKRVFPSGDVKVLAVDDISFKVPEGQFASIVGKSGSGKSTLLSLLGARVAGHHTQDDANYRSHKS